MEQLRFILFALALVISAPSLAQRFDYFGISGGLARNVAAGSEIENLKKFYNVEMSPRVGPMFWMFLKNEITPSLYFKVEAAYVRKGNTSKNDPLWNLNVEYISIPLKIGYQPVNFVSVGKDVQFGIDGGVSINYALQGGLDNLKTAYSRATNVQVNRFGISVLFGTHLEYRISPRRIVFLNSTWYYDVTPLLSYESGNAEYSATHKGWLLSAGIMFPLH